MKCYCEKCNVMADYTVQTVSESFPVYGEQVKIQASVAVCKTCGAIIFNEELDSKNLLMAQALYRKKHKLIHDLFLLKLLEILEKHLAVEPMKIHVLYG